MKKGVSKKSEAGAESGGSSSSDSSDSDDSDSESESNGGADVDAELEELSVEEPAPKKMKGEQKAIPIIKKQKEEKRLDEAKPEKTGESGSKWTGKAKRSQNGKKAKSAKKSKLEGKPQTEKKSGPVKANVTDATPKKDKSEKKRKHAESD